MALTTANVVDTKSGTGFTLDVTACNLLPDLSIKDFIVLIDSVLEPNSNITKTSQTVLTYTGASIPSSTVEVRRVTPNDRFQDITFAERFSSTVYNEEVDRAIRRGYEYTLNGIGPGSTVTVVTPLNEAYPGSWSSDTNRSRTANNLFTEFEARGTLSENEAITGDWTAPTQTDVDNSTKLATTAYSDTRVTNALSGSPALGGNPTATTQSEGNDSTRIATTAFVERAVDNALVWRRVATFTGTGASSTGDIDLSSLTTAPTHVKIEGRAFNLGTTFALTFGINSITPTTTVNKVALQDGATDVLDTLDTGGHAVDWLTLTATANVGTQDTVFFTSDIILDTTNDEVLTKGFIGKLFTGIFSGNQYRFGYTTGGLHTGTGITTINLKGFETGTSTTKNIPTNMSLDVYALQP